MAMAEDTEPDVEQPDGSNAEIIHAAIQKAIVNTDTEELKQGAIVTKWVCIVELMDATEGDKWLTGYRGPTPNAIPVWDAKGLLDYASAEMEFSEDEEDDEE